MSKKYVYKGKNIRLVLLANAEFDWLRQLPADTVSTYILEISWDLPGFVVVGLHRLPVIPSCDPYRVTIPITIHSNPILGYCAYSVSKRILPTDDERAGGTDRVSSSSQ